MESVVVHIHWCNIPSMNILEVLCSCIQNSISAVRVCFNFRAVKFLTPETVLELCKSDLAAQHGSFSVVFTYVTWTK